MNFDGFESYAFPSTAQEPVGEVYVICYLDDGIERPFYVGQTGRFLDRMGDYDYAQFAAATDFKVGQAIKHLRASGRQIIVRHKHSEDRFKEERQLITAARAEGVLLNDCLGYDYKSVIRDEMLSKVREFCNANYR